MVHSILLEKLSKLLTDEARPLSETTTSGELWVANIICNLSMVVSAVAEVVTCTFWRR